MSQPGLEVFESTLQKTQLMLKDLTEAAHVDKPTAYKARIDGGTGRTHSG